MPSFASELRRQLTGMNEHVRDYRADVLRYRPQVVRDRKPRRLSRLGHHVRHVDDGIREVRERFQGSGSQKRGDGAREQTPRAQDHHVRLFHGPRHPRRRGDTFGLDGDPGDPPLPGVHGGDRRLAPDHRAVGVVGHQGQALDRRRKDPALYAQEAGRLLDALAKPPGHVRERRDDEVPHRVVREVAPAFEAVVKDLGEPFASGKRHQAVPHVARRRHPQLLPQPSARSSVVRHRDDRHRIPDPVLEAPEQYRQPRTSAERHHPQVIGSIHTDKYNRPSSRSGSPARGHGPRTSPSYFSQNVDGVSGQQHDDRQRDRRLHHHQPLCPARQHRRVGRRERRAGVEGQKQVIHEPG